MDNRDLAIVGHKVSEDNFVGQMVPLRFGGKPDRCYLYVWHNLFTNEAGYLTDAKANYEVFLEDDFNSEPLLRYDYIREPANQWPVAHLHVHGVSTGFDELFALAGRTHHALLSRLHLPVGGKRYRPSLEDLIEFLIREELVDGRDGWEAVIQEQREEWFRRQLSAAVKDDPVTAKKALDEWKKENPDSDL